MILDLAQVPFSRYGSYLAINHLEGYTFTDRLSLRSVHTQDRGRALFQIEMWRGQQRLAFSEQATPEMLCLNEKGDSGADGAFAACEICFSNENTLRFRVRECRLLLRMASPESYHLAYPAPAGCWEINAYSHKLMVCPLRGSLEVDAPWEITRCSKIDIILNAGEEQEAEFALEEYENSWTPHTQCNSFEKCAQTSREDFQVFLEHTPSVPERFCEARELAAYLNWSAVVAPSGNFKRPAMLMSKNWMSNVWSWDHCFNAMALARSQPELAMAQFQIPFDNQDGLGALPDCVSDVGAIHNFVKPPIHGLALRYIMKHSEAVTDAWKEKLYEPLCRWTDWWFACRDWDADGIPQYHHGNDSGWDNATPFRETPVVESADLSAFLVIQLDVLADLAEALGRKSDADVFHSRSKDLLARMLPHFERDNGLPAVASGTHRRADGDSLFNYLPLVLGKQLPGYIRGHMIEQLKEPGRFRTGHGLATESTGSLFYEPDGYWRGPIWAPSTFLLIYGLEQSGEAAFCRELAEQFCGMCSVSGMAENFNAVTGEGLRDRAYTWTSSVFLLLAHDYLMDSEDCLHE